MVAVFSACGKNEPYSGDDFENVVIYYGGGYNNLSSAIATNVNELCSGEIPGIKSHNALLAFCHTTDTYGDYTTKHSPVLIRIYSDKKGNQVRDTLKVFTPDTKSIDESTLNTVLSTIKKDFPAKHYGFLFSSHSTGWIPPGYTRADEKYFSSTMGVGKKERSYDPYATMPQSPEFPETKSIGAQYRSSSTSAYMMELAAFAKAFPMKMDYIIFDSCLMGCIEVAYELKDICSKIIFSPTEILKQGLIYPPMAGHLLKYPAELETICKEYFNYYNTEAQTKAATIALIDCSKVDAVASDMAAIIDAHRSDIHKLTENDVQRYWYNEGASSKHWFYDMRDIAVQAGATSAELAKLDSDLASMVTYKAATPTFFNLDIDPAKYSGLSMYLPTLSWDTLNTYYKTLGWNKKVCLLK